jgi:hypothetical protein
MLATDKIEATEFIGINVTIILGAASVPVHAQAVLLSQTARSWGMPDLTRGSDSELNQKETEQLCRSRVDILIPNVAELLPRPFI